jgi:hypothetical protein
MHQSTDGMADGSWKSHQEAGPSLNGFHIEPSDSADLESDG